MSDQIVYVRLPGAVIEIVDTAVSAGLYKDRTEVLRELVRNGIKGVLYKNKGGFCIDLKKIVDCCHDDKCKHHDICKIHTQ